MIKYDEYNPVSLSADIDLEEALDNRNNRQVWDWCRQYTLISESEQKKWFEKIHSDPKIKMFQIENNCWHVGVCGFTSIDRQNRNAEFSLYIDTASQGKGYGELALKTLLRHGFEDWGFHRIWGEVFEGNPAMKIFERIGFTLEGTLRSSYWRKGSWIDSHMISILAGEFKK